jgi:hypothetical protein
VRLEARDHLVDIRTGLSRKERLDSEALGQQTRDRDINRVIRSREGHSVLEDGVVTLEDDARRESPDNVCAKGLSKVEPSGVVLDSEEVFQAVVRSEALVSVVPLQSVGEDGLVGPPESTDYDASPVDGRANAASRRSCRESPRDLDPAEPEGDPVESVTAGHE